MSGGAKSSAAIAGMGDVLEFWFGPPEVRASGLSRELWFKKDPEFDSQIRERFLATHEAAARGDLDSWIDSARGCLALLILLDQFPRNLFRGDARSYATDAKARNLAEEALGRGFEQTLGPLERGFLYLPFEHSERLEDQVRAVVLVESLPDRGDIAIWKKSAQRHYEIIARFGRFPHRNAILGRASTEEELAFLEEPDSAF